MTYELIADGITDDTQALQAWFEMKEVTHKGAVLGDVLEGMTLRIDGTIDLYDIPGNRTVTKCHFDRSRTESEILFKWHYVPENMQEILDNIEGAYVVQK